MTYVRGGAHVKNDYPLRTYPSGVARGSSDQTAVLPTAIGTAISVVALIIASFLLPITPPESGVWWWGVFAAATITGVLALMFFIKRSKRFR